MKKNKMMRVASALLVAVLMTTSVISGTFAKYITQDSASDTARVAKWGVELQVVGNLYGDTYGASDAIVNGNDFTVKSNQHVDDDANKPLVDVVAPGTKNDKGFTISLKGQPEVAGKVTTTMKIQNVFLKTGKYGIMIPVDDGLITAANFAEFTAEDALYIKDGDNFTKAASWDNNWTDPEFYTLEDYVDLTSYYYPVVYNLAGSTNTDATPGVITSNSLKAAADKIAEQLGLTAGDADDDTSITYTGTPKAFDANTNLAGWNCDGLTLTWAWEFERASNKDMYNGADTILGSLRDGFSTEGVVVKLNDALTSAEAPTPYTDYCLDTMFSIDIKVEQVD